MAELGSCRLRIAFASERHARLALEFLAALANPPTSTSIEDEASLTFLEVEIRTADRERVSTLMRGVHGIPVELPAVIADVA
jgi:hypothetical protein